MNDKLLIKYRTWYKGVPPKPIKLEIPGWTGDLNKHQNGDKPQPWHCPPFVEGSSYGLELCYPFDSECKISMVNGEIRFDGDFTDEQKHCPDVPLPPFMSFSPGHFGMTSSLDIKVPTGYVLRLETHPRYYTDTTYTVPCTVPGHIQTEWWPKIFFVVFKNPMPGQTIIFRKGEPYGQVLVVPKKVTYEISEMDSEESRDRAIMDMKINTHFKKFVKNSWYDHKGNSFNDKYKVLSAIFSKKGLKGVEDFLESFDEKLKVKKMFVGKLVKGKRNETI